MVTAAVTYLLTWPGAEFAIAGRRDARRSGPATCTAIPTPRLGGIAMFGGLCAGLLVAAHLTYLEPASSSDADEPRALLSGAALIWLLGVARRQVGLDALIKLGGQMIAAGVMVLQGLTISSCLPAADPRRRHGRRLAPRQGTAAHRRRWS